VWLAGGVAEDDLQVDGNRGGLVAELAGLEAVLGDGCEDVLVFDGIGGLNDLEILGLAGLVDDHGDDDVAIDVGDAPYGAGFGWDIDGGDEFGSSDTGGDANWGGGAGTGAACGEEHGGGEDECCKDEVTHDI
jgi:hypothetical protein